MRHILHADMDAFYASVEQLDNPKLRGKPVVVGGSPEGRGVVAAASYEARKFGVRSAMPMHTALQKCPQAVRVTPRFDRYLEISRHVMQMFRDITPIVEPLSLDEAYLDVTDAVAAGTPPESIATSLRARVRTDTGLTISVGVATSKSVAKIASDLNKPDGLTVVRPGSERQFLAPLDVGKLWGIGPKTEERLAAEGVRTIGELAAKPDAWFAKRFGSNGAFFKSLAQGRDDRAVVTHRERKQVSAETTLSRDTGDPEALVELVDRLSQRVARQLGNKGAAGRTVKIKLRLSDFTTFTRQETLAEPSAEAGIIAAAAEGLLRAELRPGRKFRLVGVGVSGFDHEDEEDAQEPVQLRFAGW
ncbi:MAG: DNA polymerase IV [SAR202 cluster bacterium]|nr:DNA polymerase IV [SAR202 cluster bacterium]